MWESSHLLGKIDVLESQEAHGYVNWPPLYKYKMVENEVKPKINKQFISNIRTTFSYSLSICDSEQLGYIVCERFDAAFNNFSVIYHGDSWVSYQYFWSFFS